MGGNDNINRSKTMETVIANPYSVKNVKTFMGREGYGFECSLYKDGKRLGVVTDTCDGGGMLQMCLKDNEERVLEDYCKLLPAETSEFPVTPPPREGEYKGKMESITIDIDPCIFVGRLVDKFETTKQYKKWCKKQTVFRVDGDDEGSFRTLDHLFTDRIKDHLVKKYPDCGLYIVNEHLT
jgi:hypothetical protein